MVQQINKLKTIKDYVKTTEDAKRKKNIRHEIRKADEEAINITHNVTQSI